MTHGREPDAHAEACHPPDPGRENDRDRLPVRRGTRKAGRARQTFYRWLKEETFRNEYRRQQDLIFDLAFETMRRNVQEGADKLAGLLETDNPQLLRHVCRDVLDYALKMKEMTDVDARIDVLERTVAESRRK